MQPCAPNTYCTSSWASRRPGLPGPREVTGQGLRRPVNRARFRVPPGTSQHECCQLSAVFWKLETALLQEGGGGTGSIVPVIHSHFLLPHRAGLQPHRWALLLPRAGCLAPRPRPVSRPPALHRGQQEPESPGSDDG